MNGSVTATEKAVSGKLRERHAAEKVGAGIETKDLAASIPPKVLILRRLDIKLLKTGGLAYAIGLCLETGSCPKTNDLPKNSRPSGWAGRATISFDKQRTRKRVRNGFYISSSRHDLGRKRNAEMPVLPEKRTERRSGRKDLLRSRSHAESAP